VFGSWQLASTDSRPAVSCHANDGIDNNQVNKQRVDPSGNIDIFSSSPLVLFLFLFPPVQFTATSATTMAENQPPAATLNRAVTLFCSQRNRAPGALIVKVANLTPDEAIFHADLMQKERKLFAGNADKAFEYVDWHRYWSRVFKHWNSLDDENEERHPATNVKVGVLKYDHPLTSEFRGNRQPPERQRGAKVFISVTTNTMDDTLLFLWEDELGKFINPIHAQLDNPDVGAAYFKAISRHDNCIRKSHHNHYMGLVIRSARRRIVYFAGHGSEKASVPAGSGAPVIIEPEYAGPRFDMMSDAFARIKTKPPGKPKRSKANTAIPSSSKYPFNFQDNECSLV
jgi:hypothetical protein